MFTWLLLLMPLVFFFPYGVLAGIMDCFVSVPENFPSFVQHYDFPLAVKYSQPAYEFKEQNMLINSRSLIMLAIIIAS